MSRLPNVATTAHLASANDITSPSPLNGVVQSIDMPEPNPNASEENVNTRVVIPDLTHEIDPTTGLYSVIPPFPGFESVKFNRYSFAKGLPSDVWGILIGAYFGGLAMRRSDNTTVKWLLFADSFFVNYLGAVLLFPKVIELLKNMWVRKTDVPYMVFVLSGTTLAILSSIPIIALAQDASQELFASWPLSDIPNGDVKNNLKNIGDACYVLNNAISRTWGAVYQLTLGWELTLMRRVQPDRYFLREVAKYLEDCKEAHPHGFEKINDEFLKQLFHNIKTLRLGKLKQKSCSEKLMHGITVGALLGSFGLPPLLLYLSQKGGNEITRIDGFEQYSGNSTLLVWSGEAATHMFYLRAIYLLCGILWLQVIKKLVNEFKKLPLLVCVPLVTIIMGILAALCFPSGEGMGVEGRELEKLLQQDFLNTTNNTNPYNVFGTIAATTYFSWASNLYAIIAPHYGSYWAAYAGAVNLTFVLTSLKESLANKTYYHITFIQSLLEYFFRAYGLKDKLSKTKETEENPGTAEAIEIQRRQNIEDSKQFVHAVTDFNKARQLRDNALEPSEPGRVKRFFNKCCAFFSRGSQQAGFPVNQSDEPFLPSPVNNDVSRF